MDWWQIFLFVLAVVPVAVLWLGSFIDVLSRHDLNLIKKVLWTLVLCLPLFGVVAYLLFRPVVVSVPSFADRSRGIATLPASSSSGRN